VSCPTSVQTAPECTTCQASCSNGLCITLKEAPN
ncbi:unnamed protein product, partial [Tenebrio molitor]